MRTAVGLVSLLFCVLACLLLQQFLPPFSYLHGARLVLVPMVFCYAAIALPFPAMLAGAVFTGLVSDLMYLHVVDGQVEIALGWSIFFFVIFGCISHGLHDSLERNRWWVCVPVAAIATCAYLFAQFAMISFRRSGFVADPAILWRILAPGIAAAILAPFLHFLVRFFASFLPEPPRLSGRNY